jgi:pimeloyl-ACP methyl ester carboxylesterase
LYNILLLISSYLQVSTSITLHYRDSQDAGLPPILLLHSLSDNTYAFDAIIAAGLTDSFRVIAPDMRGRGASSRPITGYTLDDHCADIICLLDKLGLEKVNIAGHSFGALLALYFAAHYPERVLGLTMLDAAAELHPLTALFLLVAGDRLGKWYWSEESYISKIRAAPYMTMWDEHMHKTFMADTTELADGSLMVKTEKRHIVQCSAGIAGIPAKEWRHYASEFKGPALLLSASAPFMNCQHILPLQKAIETVVLLSKGTHGVVEGNHITMLFGKGAKQIVQQIRERFTSKRGVAVTSYS